MIDWFYYHGNDISKMSKEQVKIEIRTQRFLMRMFERQIYFAKYAQKKTEETYQEFLEEVPEDAPRYALRRSRRENSVLLKKACVDVLTQLHSASQGAVRRLEEVYVARDRKKTNDQRLKALENAQRKFRDNIRRTERIERVWNKEAFYAIAEDRGYKVRDALLNDLSKELDIPLKSAEKLIQQGRFTWGQVLIIGAMLEMTPREFSETFMRGYFEEVSEGQYRAWANKDELIYIPVPKEPLPPPTVIMVGSDGEPVTEIEASKYEYDYSGYE